MSETKMPKGRPPKHMNVILKSTLNQPEKAPEQEIINPVESEVEQKPALIPEKKPRTEAQVAATKRMLEAKGKRAITIHQPLEKAEPQTKPDPKVEPKPEVKEQPDMYKMLQNMEERLAKMNEPKPKVTKPKKAKVKVEEPKAPKAPAKPKPKPKPKQYDSEDESEPESDDEYVSKYQRKAEKRFQAVQQIEQRLQAVKKPAGRYDHLSLF
jgi:hypothetical protein